jgi:hypothetical protein
MNASTTKRIHEPARGLAALALVLAAILGCLTGCDGGREGDRCNPDLSHNDCNDGLTCVQPSTCVENYCCPADPMTSTNNYCNGRSCPEDTDAGAAPSDASEAGPPASGLTDGGAD